MSADPLAVVLAKLPTARATGDTWAAKCPAHDDHVASLSISKGRDGRVLLKCHASCNVRAIVEACGLTMRDLFPAASGGREPEQVFAYLDEQRSLLFEVVRFAGKQFRQRRPDGVGAWAWTLNGVRRVLYRLPDLVGHKTIVIVEGEKDTDTLWRQGIAATTNPHGAGKWREDYVDQLKAAGCQRVAILPDHDTTGDCHARAVARSCLAGGLTVKVVPLVDLPPKGDVSDYLQTHTRDELLTAIKDAPLFDPRQRVAAPLPALLTSLSQLLDEPDAVHDWIVEDRVPAGALTLLVAPPKTGKSTLARHLAYAVATGEPFLGWPTQAGPVWYLVLEEKRGEIKKGFRRLGATGREPIHLFLDQAPADLVARLTEQARDTPPALIVVDTLQRLIKAKDLNDYAGVTSAFEPLLNLCRQTGAALLLLHHASAHAVGREGIDAVLGSTALSGSVDNVLVLTRTPDQRRVLSSDQRIGPNLDAVVVTLDEAKGRLALAGRKVDLDDAAIADRIVAVLREQPDAVPEKWIQDHVEGRKADQERVLRRLLGMGHVGRTGAGKRGDPYVYTITKILPPEPPEVRNQKLVIENKGDRFDFDSPSRPSTQIREGENKNSPSTYVVPRTYDAPTTSTNPITIATTPGNAPSLPPDDSHDAQNDTTKTRNTTIKPGADSPSQPPTGHKHEPF